MTHRKINHEALAASSCALHATEVVPSGCSSFKLVTLRANSLRWDCAGDSAMEEWCKGLISIYYPLPRSDVTSLRPGGICHSLNLRDRLCFVLCFLLEYALATSFSL